MLKKVVAIKNVGRFRNCGTSGDVEFRRATLVFAPNARGKTTLCDILRSLRTGNGAYILGRRTLGSPDDPQVTILTGTGARTFKQGTWSSPYPHLEVYDARFVHENVHAGECVGHDQRRNLYDVILGEEGVTLKADCDKCDADGREANRSEKEKEAELQKLVPPGIALAKFLSLELDADVDPKIEAAKKSVALLEESSKVQQKSLLGLVQLPELPAGLDAMLGKTLEDVSANAEETIRKHMAAHMNPPDQTWLGRGLEMMSGAACPFCAQSVDGSALLAAYRTHFDASYRNLKSEVAMWPAKVRAFADNASFLGMKQTVDANTRLLAEWAAYLTTERLAELDVEAVRAPVVELKRLVEQAVESKGKAPMEKFDITSGRAALAGNLDAATALVKTYNSAVERINAALRAKRDESRGGNLSESKQELGVLQATKVRHTPEALAACESLAAARSSRQANELLKTAAKLKLEEYSKDVFQRYQGRINGLLKKFGTSFRIGNTMAEYPGGKPRTSYSLTIETMGGGTEEVELGDAKTPLGEPSFKNTLSAGDKSALALAFFLAQVEASPQLAQKVVVLDDPFTSQDRSRMVCTQQSIRKLAEKAAQVVVLSHDPRFLKLVWDELPADTRNAIQLTELGGVMAWDVESEVMEEYYQNFTTLWKYCEYRDGDQQNVVKTIRILLEQYLRWKLPKDLDSKGWLGAYVEAIVEAAPGSVLAHAQCIAEELTDIKDYCKRYHHPQGGPTGVLADAQEVATYGSRALELVQKF